MPRDIIEPIVGDLTFSFSIASDGRGQPVSEGIRVMFGNAWAARWRKRLGEEPQDVPTRQTAMRAVNPAFIPRNDRAAAWEP